MVFDVAVDVVIAVVPVVVVLKNNNDEEEEEEDNCDGGGSSSCNEDVRDDGDDAIFIFGLQLRRGVTLVAVVVVR